MMMSNVKAGLLNHRTQVPEQLVVIKGFIIDNKITLYTVYTVKYCWKILILCLQKNVQWFFSSFLGIVTWQ